MNLIKPPFLKEGDTIAIIAPAGAVDEEKILMASDYFKNAGYKVKLGKNLFKTFRCMAGTDEDRADDLNNAFGDDEINAIICARGGYGSIRLLNLIDFDLIKRNPKIFCGYSDITALSLMMLKYSGLVTFSGPMAQSDFANITEFTANSVFNVLKGADENYSPSKPYKEGNAKGIIWGGNLSTIVSLCGTDFIPEEDFILFTEDLNEPLYKIDKMLSQLINIEQFRKNIKGIAFGEFLDTEDGIDEILMETAEKLKVPAYGSFKFTHGADKQTIPVGANGCLQDGILSYTMV